jgi:FtsH-binding integral membrane protein
MPRTFSLFSLMLVVTAFCLLCGLAVNFPFEVMLAWICFGLFGPTAIVWLILARRSKERSILTALTIVGGCIGLDICFVGLIVLSPVAVSRVPGIAACLVSPGLGLGAAFGGLLFGRAALTDEIRQRGGEP